MLGIFNLIILGTFILILTVKQVYARNVSTWHVYRQFDVINAGRSWRDKVKPFNFFVRAAYWEEEAMLSGKVEVQRFIQACDRSLPVYDTARKITPELLDSGVLTDPIAALLYDLFAYDDEGNPVFDSARISNAKTDLFYRLYTLGKGHVRQSELDHARMRAGVLLAADEWAEGSSFSQRDRTLLVRLADADDDRVLNAIETLRDRRLRGRLSRKPYTKSAGERYVSLAAEEGAARLRENRSKPTSSRRVTLSGVKQSVIRKSGHWISIYAAYERTGSWETLTWYRAKDGSRVDPVDELGFQTLGRTVHAYHDHPEHPYYGPDGQPCSKKTRGVMQRRPVAAVGCFYTGKQVPTLDIEWDEIEDADYDPRILYDGTGDDWAKVLPVLRDMGAEQVAEELQTTVDAVKKWLSGNSRPLQIGEAMELVIGQAAQLTGMNGLAALDAYLGARETLIREERALLASLSPRDIAVRYGVSLKQARRYKDGTQPPFRHVIIARQATAKSELSDKQDHDSL